jgi:MFS family permease
VGCVSKESSQENGDMSAANSDPILDVATQLRRQSLKNNAILNRNKKLSYVISVTHNVGFLTPVWVIFGTDKLGLSLLLSLILGSTGWVSSSIFEVPMGAFADKYGRKLSLVFGLALAAIGDLSLVVFNTFWLLMFFQILAGVGFALSSGSFEGLLHDTFEEQGDRTSYAKLSSRLLSLLNISRFVTVPIGAWLYSLNVEASLSSYTYPYIASVLCYCIALVCVSMLVEKRSSQQPQTSETGQSLKGFSHVIFGQVGATWKSMMANKDVKRVLILLGLYALIGEGNWALYQSYFRHRGISVSDTGWFYMAIVACMAAGAIYVAKIYKKINVMWAMIIVIAIVTFDIVLMHLPIIFTVPAFILSAFVGPMCWYFQDNAIQNRMSGDQKTTALSISSMAYNIGAMVGVFGVGAIADKIGELDAQWVFVGYGTIVVLVMGAWCWNDGFAIRPEDALATTEEIPFDDVPQNRP